MKKVTIEINLATADPVDQCWIRIKHGNGRIMMDSELYDSAANARRAAKNLSKLIPGSVVKDLTK